MNSVRFFMSRHPINLQQIGAGWLWGLFFSPVLHVKHHVVVLADWMTSSVAVASLEPRFFSFCSCAWSGFWEYFFVLFNVAVWVSWKVKIKIRKKKQIHVWVAGEAEIVTHEMKDQVTLLEELCLITSQSSFHRRLAVVLIEFFCFQGWEFKDSFQILKERTVSRGSCCSLYLVCVSTSVRKHSSPVFSFQHSLHSCVDVGCRISSPPRIVRKQNVVWCYCPAGPSWVISMHNRHTPVNRSRLEVKGEWS